MSFIGKNTTPNTAQVWSGSKWISLNNLTLQDSGANAVIGNVNTGNIVVNSGDNIELSANNGLGTVVITGNLQVDGYTTTIDSVNVNVQDAYLALGVGYNSGVDRPAGLVEVRKTTSSSFAITQFLTSSTASSSDPGLSAGDVIQIQGSSDPANNGLFVFSSWSGGVLTIDTVPSYFQTLFNPGGAESATLQRVNVSILRSKATSGQELSDGDNVNAINFGWKSIVTDLQTAYEGGNTISATAVNGAVTIDNGTESVDVINLRQNGSNVFQITSAGAVYTYGMNNQDVSTSVSGTGNITNTIGGTGKLTLIGPSGSIVLNDTTNASVKLKHESNPVYIEGTGSGAKISNLPGTNETLSLITAPEASGSSSIEIRTGTSAASTGGVSLITENAGTTSGALSFTTGTGTNTGLMNFVTGAASAGASGGVTFITGSGTTQSGGFSVNVGTSDTTGGTILLSAGDGTTNGTGGEINLYAGDGAGSGNGGNINITAGSAPGAGTGGNAILSAPDGQATLSASTGATVSTTTGNLALTASAGSAVITGGTSVSLQGGGAAADRWPTTNGSVGQVLAIQSTGTPNVLAWITPASPATETLAQTLDAGNTTDGYDIDLTQGSVIKSTDGSVVIQDSLDIYGDGYISGSLTIDGKLTVGGLIDPTGLVLDHQLVKPFNQTGTKGVIWINDNDGYLYYNDDVIGGAAVVTANWAQVLASGNLSGGAGNNPTLQGTDYLTSTLGNTLTIKTKDNTGTTDGILISSGEVTSGTGNVGSVIISGGLNNGTGNGGSVSLTATGANGSGTGGSINLNSGASVGNIGGGIIGSTGSGTDGGNFNFTLGNGTSGVGGAFLMNAGSGTSSGGGITISGGDGATNGTGGPVSITSGDGAGTGSGGSMNLWAGSGTASGAGGGVFNIKAGNGSGSGVGGDVDIQAGYSTGSAGDIRIHTQGTAGSTDGNITLFTGDSTSTHGYIKLATQADSGSRKGSFVITAPATNDGSGITLDTGAGSVGAGSYLHLDGGTATSGGSVDLRAGGGNGGASGGGNVNIQAGTGGAGPGGNVVITGIGAGAGGGNITLASNGGTSPAVIFQVNGSTAIRLNTTTIASVGTGKILSWDGTQNVYVAPGSVAKTVIPLVAGTDPDPAPVVATLQANEITYYVDTTASSFTVTLPSPAPAAGTIVRIKGNAAASSNNITISSAANIDGAGSVFIGTSYGSLTVQSTGSTYIIV